MAERDVYWLDRRRPAVRPPLAGDTHADVAVVGGGFTGLWTVLALLDAEPELRVVLLEAGTVGVGASGRNGGFLDPSLTHGLTNGGRHFPRELDRLETLAADNYRGLRADLDRYGVDCAFEPNGMLEVATEPWQVEELRAAAEAHARRGDEVEWLDADEARERLASPLVLAGLRRPAAGGVLDPVALVDGLAAAADRLGATVHETSPVTGLRRDAAGVRALTPTGSVRADRVVVATDAWTRMLLPAAARRYVTVYDYVLVTEPLAPDRRAAIGWKGREGVSDAGNRFHYFRLTADDRVLWGGYDAVRHGHDAVGARYDRWPATHDRLERHFRAFFPQLDQVRFTHRWGGPIAVTTRFTPAFGQALGGRVHYALGYTGLGVAASRFAAGVLAAAARDRADDRRALRFVRRPPLPFPPEPLRSWSVALTQRSLARADEHGGRRDAWLRLLDRLGVGFDS